MAAASASERGGAVRVVWPDMRLTPDAVDVKDLPM
jgi:hypothetical protein